MLRRLVAVNEAAGGCYNMVSVNAGPGRSSLVEPVPGILRRTSILLIEFHYRTGLEPARQVRQDA
jgi:hypothetical protein